MAGEQFLLNRPPPGPLTVKPYWARGLVACYAFNERGGMTVIDRAPENRHPGTLTGFSNITGSASCWSSRGLTFQPTLPSVNCGSKTSLNALGSFTIEAIFYLASSLTDFAILANKGTSASFFDNNFSFALTPARLLRFKGTFSNAHELDSNRVLSIGPNHVFGIYDASQQIAQLYIGGVRDINSNTDCKNPSAVTTPLILGGGLPSGGYGLPGVIGLVNYWNGRALSAAEVRLRGSDPYEMFERGED